MIYLEYFTFPDSDREFDLFLKQKRTCYDSFYPFQILSRHHLRRIDFEPVTILYGGNGSGKTTVLNVIGEKLRLARDSVFNKSNFFQDYLDAKYADFQMRSMDDYERLKKVTKARRLTQSRYVRSELMDNIREYSNGESAFIYFSEKITENGLFLLDEPENSLSPARQQELVKFLEDSARFFGCQFVISTHSPFLLSMRGAKIYDLDEDPADVKRWTELENVRAYYTFFRDHCDEFTD